MKKRKVIILQCIDFTDEEAKMLKYQIKKLNLDYDVTITNKKAITIDNYMIITITKAISIEELIKTLEKLK